MNLRERWSRIALAFVELKVKPFPVVLIPNVELVSEIYSGDDS
jgi:hypothetical protein